MFPDRPVALSGSRRKSMHPLSFHLPLHVSPSQSMPWLAGLSPWLPTGSVSEDLLLNFQGWRRVKLGYSFPSPLVLQASLFLCEGSQVLGEWPLFLFFFFGGWGEPGIEFMTLPWVASSHRPDTHYSSPAGSGPGVACLLSSELCPACSVPPAAPCGRHHWLPGNNGRHWRELGKERDGVLLPGLCFTGPAVLDNSCNATPSTTVSPPNYSSALTFHLAWHNNGSHFC